MEPVVTGRLQETVPGIILVGKAVRIVEDQDDPGALGRYSLLRQLRSFGRERLLHEMLDLLACIALPFDLREVHPADAGSCGAELPDADSTVLVVNEKRLLGRFRGSGRLDERRGIANERAPAHRIPARKARAARHDQAIGPFEDSLVSSSVSYRLRQRPAWCVVRLLSDDARHLDCVCLTVDVNPEIRRIVVLALHLHIATAAVSFQVVHKCVNRHQFFVDAVAVL